MRSAAPDEAAEILPARHSKGSPIYGMPILEVDKAQCVMVVKRSMRPGFAGIENELSTTPRPS